MTIRLVEQADFLEFEHAGKFGSAERLDRLLRGTQLAAHETEGQPLLINFLEASYKEDDRGKRADFLAMIITHPFFMKRRVALVGISHEDAEPALIGASVRGNDAQVFDDRDAAVQWLMRTRS